MRLDYISQMYMEDRVVKIRLKRFGAKKRPYYRVVVMDVRKPRNGEAIEEIGTYQPIEAEESQINIKLDRVDYWLGVGAKPSDTVRSLIKKQRAKA